MSETVKLIIEIPKDMFEWFKNEEIIDKYDESALKQVFKNGIPLDDVKAEIKTFTIAEKSKYDRGFNEAVLKCFNALDNIGKGDSE